MTITAYYPVFHVKDIDAAVKEYTEELGFKLVHSVNDEFASVRILEVNGYRIELLSSEMDFIRNKPEGFLNMRVNVREFDEAVAYFQAHGYRLDAEIFSTSSGEFAPMRNDRNELLFVSHHIRRAYSANTQIKGESQ